MQRYELIVQSICIDKKMWLQEEKKQEVFLSLLDFKCLTCILRFFINLLNSNYLSVNLNI